MTTRIVEPDFPPGPRCLKETGSPEWCWQTLRMLKIYLMSINQRWLEAGDVVAELESVTAWKVLGYPSFDQLCEEQLGAPAREVLSRIDTEKIKALRKSVGRPSRTELDGVPALTNVGTTNIRSARDNDAAYAIARLKRDRPDLAARVIAGELSPNAAAIEAGFRHPMISVRADDAAAAVKSLLSRYTGEQLLAALASLTAENRKDDVT